MLGHERQSTLSTTAFKTSALAALDCDVPFTVIAIQPSIHASDLSSNTAQKLRAFINNAGSKIVVPYAHGEFDTEELINHVASTCEADVERFDASANSHNVYEDLERRVVVVDLTSLPISPVQRKQILNDNDAFLHSVIDSLPTKDYNLIYTSTPPPALPASFRRQHISLETMKKSNSTGGLFSHYQYFTPGIFMGYMALLILVSVLIMGLQAINSLQISYRAFEPTKQK